MKKDVLLKKLKQSHVQGNDSQYYVVEFPSFPTHLIGLDNFGQPCVLISTSDNFPQAPIRLTGLDIKFAIPCNLRQENKVNNQKTLTGLTCTSQSPGVHDYFLHMMELILRFLGNTPSIISVSKAVKNLIDIMQYLNMASQKKVMGLFAELVFINLSADPISSIFAWRNDADERFDFSSENCRLEVKASGKRKREHSFSYEQCNPPSSCTGVLVSILLDKSGGGVSLSKIIEDIESKISKSEVAILKFNTTLAQTLGIDLIESLNMGFDLNSAIASLRFFDLKTIPAIRSENITPAISQIHFTVDLTDIPYIEPKEISLLDSWLTKVISI